MKRSIVLTFAFLFLLACDTEEPASTTPVNPNPFPEVELTLPKISILNVIQQSTTEATSTAEVTSSGGALVSSRGVVWSHEPTPNLDDNFTVDGEGLGDFTAELTGLEKGEIYYVRAYATNKVGTVYSEELVLTIEGGIYEGSITFSRQNQIGAFALNGYETVTGRISIFGNSVVDLKPLRCLKIIGGELSIDGVANLENLDGLENLTSIGGSLKIANNISLETTEALSALQNVGGRLNIYNNGILEHLSGLENITTIGEDVNISENDALVDLSGLYGITLVDEVNIFGNPALVSLEGLNNINSIPVRLTINNNEQLANIAALQSLSSVGSLEVIRSHSLQNLNGLDGLATINGRLNLFINASLADLTALSNISFIEDELTIASLGGLTSLEGLNNLTSLTGPMTIVSNEQLGDFCALLPLFANNGFNGNYTVSANLFNPSQQDLEEGICSMDDD
ncbi:MAG: hypothetical protein AAFP76_10030 [Bacteroidota bacterium]